MGVALQGTWREAIERVVEFVTAGDTVSSISWYKLILAGEERRSGQKGQGRAGTRSFRERFSLAGLEMS